MKEARRAMKLQRREFLAAGIGLAFTDHQAKATQARPARDRLGLSHWSYRSRFKATEPQGGLTPFRDVVDLLTHTARLGGGGAQVLVKQWDDALAARVRAVVEEKGLYLEGQIALPFTSAEVPRFEADLAAFKRAGGGIARTVLLDGRRYEVFKDQPSFEAWRKDSWRALVRGEAIARRLRVKLAIENHKDLRLPEFLASLRRLSSPWVGVCVDTGNSLALAEDMDQVVDALAPYAFTTHLKDIAVMPSHEGFYMSEVPLGQGFMDLPRFCRVLRQHNPRITFNLEMITRDPLLIPCLEAGYFATMPDLPAQDLARTLALVRARGQMRLPTVSKLALAEQVTLEEENVRRSFTHARQALGL